MIIIKLLNQLQKPINDTNENLLKENYSTAKAI